MKTGYLNADLATVHGTREKSKGSYITTLAWGDRISVVSIGSDAVEVAIDVPEEQPDGSFRSVRRSGFIRSPKGRPARELVMPKNDVLKVDFVDVQQGDGSVIESPAGKVVLVDGGDNQLFARYLAARYRGSSPSNPKEIDCIVVTHGDADHFAGLTEIHESETNTRPYKRLFIHPRRVFHNGLVKRPGTAAGGKKRKETDMLGRTETIDGVLAVTELEEDLLKVGAAKMNRPFSDWQAALQAWRKRGAIRFRRLEMGDHDAFDFLADEGIKVEVLGPIPVTEGTKHGLAFLGNPPKGPRVGHDSLRLEDDEFTGASASHTINGHSIVFRLTYGAFNLLFSGDLNDESGRILTRAHNRGEINLQAEVFKVPHHGSADYSGSFLQAVAPIVSVISSGDESARKEYIHPRATIVGALGRYSRIEEPLVFVTELVAFFEMVGYVDPEFHRLKDGICVVEDGQAVLSKSAKKRFFAFQRSAFGIVKVRTDGQRLLIYTNSGHADLKEAYAYEIDEQGKPSPSEVRLVR